MNREESCEWPDGHNLCVFMFLRSSTHNNLTVPASITWLASFPGLHHLLQYRNTEGDVGLCGIRWTECRHGVWILVSFPDDFSHTKRKIRLVSREELC